MSLSWQQRLTERHQQRRAEDLWRSRPLLTSSPGVRVQVNGQWLVNFASNDYLGLAELPDLPQLAQDLHQQAGRAGSTASHLLAGHHLPHHLLEDELADWLGVERVLLFSSGYLANLAAQTALLQTGDSLYHDKLNHASLIDGARLSSARFQRYAHNDMPALARRLAQPTQGLTMVVTDGVFSMDGDWVSLSDMQPLVAEQNAVLLVDEAHSFGVLGEQGKGLFAHQQQVADAWVLRVGTLGKAFASSGAFVAGSALLIDSIAQWGRSYIYTTAQPPYQASFSRAALRFVAGDVGEQARRKLVELITFFRQGAQVLGLSLLPSSTPIQPILLGSNERALAWQAKLWQLGFWLPAIRPPTVPEGSARLRLSLSAQHTPEQIALLLAALSVCLQEEL
jgi:8-amino-7-oxononanoate synthase